MAPVILEIERRQLPLNLIFTGQHRETMMQLCNDFSIKTSLKHLYQGQEITGIVQMAAWFIRCLFNWLSQRNYYMPHTPNQREVVLVHGDTFSTLLGAIIGRLRGADVAHIEAGLRSYNVFHPFPEELTRLILFRLSNISFCAGTWACNNMVGYSSKVIDIGQNTLLDALNLMHDLPCQISPPFIGGYGIVSIHRFENIFKRKRIEQIVSLIERASTHQPLVFVLHPSTQKKLIQFNLLEKLKANSRVRLLPRMGYRDFVQLMQRANFVITDGGGNQEELSYLGIPTLLMRKATERQEGMDTTAMLCNYDATVLDDFFEKLPTAKRHRQTPETENSPSFIIVDALTEYGSTDK